MAFIVRTKTVTLAFDLVTGITSGSKDFAMTDEQLQRLVNQCDVLFITHKHADHAEKPVVEKFIDKGLPVITPEQVWKNDSVFSKISHPERNPGMEHKLRLKNGNIRFVVYPGHQMKSTDNNVYLVKTPEGISVAHLGDQINEGDFMVDFEWIDKVCQNQKVDILIPNCWTNDILRITKGFNPKLVLPGHVNEMGHPVWDRVPFWGDEKFLKLDYSEMKKKYTTVVMFWGESYHFRQK
jgi:L-ascorbate metabolism protein UlaG (beta-lactamase superfamily)